MQTSAIPKLYKRQQLLLALLSRFGGRLANVDLQKYLFLYAQLCEREKSYDFVPFRFGCFSFQSHADRRKFEEWGLIAANEDCWQLQAVAKDLPEAPKKITDKLDLFYERFGHLTGDALLRETYVRYPYYSIHSEIAGDLLSDDELLPVEACRPKQTEPCLMTIGYEGKSFDFYLNQLVENNVRTLCDVRKNPLSRKFGFSKKMLAETLPKLGINYVHLPDLGIESANRQQLNSKQDYQRLFADYEATTLVENQVALDALVKLIGQDNRVAITCFEAEECMCHRGRIAARLQDWSGREFGIEHL